MIMETFKALLIKVDGTDYEKICSTPEQAVMFLKNCNLSVTISSVKHLERIFRVINAHRINPFGEPCHTFVDSSNADNPMIAVYNYTGHYSRREFSPSNIQKICDKITEKYNKIEEDFRVNMNLFLIDGGYQWQWSDQRDAYFAIHDFTVRPCYYGNLLELEQAIDSCANNLIIRHSKNHKIA